MTAAWARSGAFCLAAAAIGLPAEAQCAVNPSIEDLSQLSIEELADIEVTSVSKRPQPLSSAAASIYVISGEDIHRSGATSLPEALRLAPNLQVARLNAFDYVVTARGFGSESAANKLLVMIDGRSIYSTLHAGVFWRQNHVPLEDIDRIEVISGPGGTLWGANAVNGVINVVTKNASDTQGGLASLSLGTVDGTATARYGGSFGAGGAYRVYATGFERGETEIGGIDAGDDWRGRQAGFRSDWQGSEDSIMVRGDIYDHVIDAGGSLIGRSLVARWNRQLDDDSSFEVQAYYDRADRAEPGFDDSQENFDIQAQHVLWMGDHQIVWGGGYRRSEELFETGILSLDPPDRTLELASAFVQDSITLDDDLILTLGTKLEYNTYTGLEHMPSVRLAWQVSEDTLLWSAVSRVVRTPSRIDRDLVAPGLLFANTDFDSEILIAYEAGYRGQPAPKTSLSLSLYLHDYDSLRTAERLTAAAVPFAVGNGAEGYTYGVEAWGDYQLRPWWRLGAGFQAIHKDIRRDAGSTDVSGLNVQGNDPDYQIFLHSYMNVTPGVTFDLGLRVVDALADPAVPGYVGLDARVGWQVSRSLEVALAGQNLLDDHHPEATLNEIPRSVHLSAQWSF